MRSVVAAAILLTGCDYISSAPSTTVASISAPDDYEPDEEWHCRERFQSILEDYPVQVTLTADFEAGNGTVRIAESVADAQYTQFETCGVASNLSFDQYFQSLEDV